ncbi:MAG TPA: IPT/TIG domain-containing protein, partial [Terriglobales bacterium]|nr:IPT/TIG domain-containing protein [Terriglobales bacterium]
MLAKQNSGAFTLTLNGFGFVNGAVVTFNGSPRPTTLVSDTQLKASIADSDLATSGTATIAVSNPSPGGGNSGMALFAIDTATSTSVSLGSPALTVAAGQSVR